MKYEFEVTLSDAVKAAIESAANRAERLPTLRYGVFNGDYLVGAFTTEASGNQFALNTFGINDGLLRRVMNGVSVRPLP
jgi:hypothetical protein